jgi:DNA polymerase-3 subunit delta'
LINADIHKELQTLSARVSFRWVERAANWAAELDRLERRNIQKQLALEALAIGLRRPA